MTADEIAQRVGLMWNGVWQVDEVKFRRAIELTKESALAEERKINRNIPFEDTL